MRIYTDTQDTRLQVHMCSKDSDESCGRDGHVDRDLTKHHTL